MSTIAHEKLAKHLGADKFFRYGSSIVRAKLPAGHPLNNGFSGTCKFNGMVSDHVLQSILDANEMAKCYAGGDVARFPQSGERILLEVLPSCTAIIDVCASYSEANNRHRFRQADTNAVGAFITDLTDPSVTGPVSVCEGTAPAASANAAFPPMDLYIGRLNSAGAEVGNLDTFQTILAREVGGAATRPEVALIGDTGSTDEIWVLYGVLSGTVPANSYATVNAHINKGGRF